MDVLALLSSLTESLLSASTSLPTTENLTPPPEGISLLDAKNELLLSYLQNLVFLILLKLRNPSPSIEPSHENVAKKLIELRVYLEKGVRPLETRLKYQIDKVLLAASSDPASHTPQPPSHQTSTGPQPKKSGRDSDDEPSTPSDHLPGIPDLAHRPNPSALVPPSHQSLPRFSSKKDGIYHPPHITPTTLPTSRPSQKVGRKSATMEEFISTEMGDAPVAEPSIGSRIVGGGRRGDKSARDRERDEERSRYEEEKMVRLPGEKKKKRGRGDGLGGDELGGGGWEGWEGLSSGLGVKRKRGGDGEGQGEVIGDKFQRRKMKSGGKKKRR